MELDKKIIDLTWAQTTSQTSQRSQNECLRIKQRCNLHHFEIPLSSHDFWTKDKHYLF